VTCGGDRDEDQNGGGTAARGVAKDRAARGRSMCKRVLAQSDFLGWRCLVAAESRSPPSALPLYSIFVNVPACVSGRSTHQASKDSRHHSLNNLSLYTDIIVGCPKVLFK
jgi:hypothetical protein